jgi:hypothetical protein
MASEALFYGLILAWLIREWFIIRRVLKEDRAARAKAAAEKAGAVPPQG